MAVASRSFVIATSVLGSGRSVFFTVLLCSEETCPFAESLAKNPPTRAEKTDPSLAPASAVSVALVFSTSCSVIAANHLMTRSSLSTGRGRLTSSDSIARAT